MGSLAQLVMPLQAPLQAVQQAMLAVIPPQGVLLQSSTRYSLEAPGKLMRPTLVLLVAQALLNEPEVLPTSITEMAAACELIHIATLLHDDVLDEADTRRGRATTSHTFGNTVAILSGDWLLAQASIKLALVGHLEVVALFSYLLADLCDGEVEQLRTRYQLEDTTWATYTRKTMGKTASLFATGAKAAGLLCNAPQATVQALWQMGQAFGMAFQLMDDLLDYTATAEELGKPVLDDLRSGLLNAPVLLALEEDRLAAPQQQALLEAITALFELAKAQASTEETEPLCQEIKALLIQANALEATRALAADYLQRAHQHLAVLPEGTARQSLQTLLALALKRST